MEIVNDGLEFDSEDQALLRQFLGSRAGQRLLPKLLEHAPQLLSGGGINEILIRTGEVRGWQEAAKHLLLLAYPPALPKPETPAYPALDDDDAWTGPRLDEKDKTKD